MKQLVRQLVVPQGDERPNLLFAPADLAKVVSWACDEYEPIAGAKKIGIVRRIAADAVMVWTDRVALGAVLDNLISNAVKYSPAGGRISVHVKRSDAEGIVSITDTGPGIQAADVPRLFTRGGKLSARPTGGEPSTGYGLAIAKDLIDGLRGRIWFENAHGGGATFSFSLPLHESGAMAEARPR
ncbi:MAG TPA: ATP-binding protein [Thermoanaerobaculia bacterium]|nr:ATP-binding protein [Thermoanaerobaculia bacterium]